MELKQLQFFKTASDCGSLTKAAALLYTSQPNVSKTISSLEKELGTPLFRRSAKGLSLTPYGRQVYQYAEVILKNASFISNINRDHNQEVLYLSSYPGHVISMVLADLYRTFPDMRLQYRQGTVEEIVFHVARGISELGVLHVAHKQLSLFRHILSQNGVEFISLGVKPACVYVGPYNPFHDRSSIKLEELSQLRFITGLTDYFSMEHRLERIDLGAIQADQMVSIAQSNSDYLLTELLLHTEAADLGISLHHPHYHSYDPIRDIPIEGGGIPLNIGYIVQRKHVLTDLAEAFVRHLAEITNL